MTDLSAPNHPREFGALLAPTATTGPLSLVEERPAAFSGVLTCSERLPRDVLVRLAALSRQVGDLRREHAGHGELTLRLYDVAADLDRLTQSIYDETVWHLAGRRR